LEKFAPRAIILDVRLRSEDTWQILADLKKNPATREIPVLIASSIEDQGKAIHHRRQ